MPPEVPSIDWVDLAERFGLPSAFVAFICLCIWKMGQFAGPIIRDYIDRKAAWQEKQAEASIVSAQAASSNADVLAATAERSIEIQKDNVELHREGVETNKRLASAFEAFVERMERLDKLVFPPHKK